MAYTDPDVISYSFGEIDFGAGTVSLEVSGLKGKDGRVVDVHLAATETFTEDTTEAFVRVGSAADADEFAELKVGATAAGTSLNADGQASALKGVSIDADEKVKVACIAPTGGTPAGKGHVTVAIAWY